MLGPQEIPVVDLHDLVPSASSESTERATAALMRGFGEFGLVYVRNHGISAELKTQFYDSFKELTDRSNAEKQKLARADVWYQRGWTPPNTEKAVIAGGQPDFKECYFVAPNEVDPACAVLFPETFAANTWPEKLPEFKASYLQIGKALHEVGEQLLRGCARALSLPEDVFVAAAKGAAHVTRALRYLPTKSAQTTENIVWGEEHTDFNMLTLLPGGRFLDANQKHCARPDESCGLYLRTRPTADSPNGIQLYGRAPEGCITAQVGQELEILSGGTFLATPHVITAPKNPEVSRQSMAHFIHLHPEQKVYPLPQFLNENTMRAYGPPVLAGTYSLKTLVDIGLAPSSALQKLGYRHYDRLADIRVAES